MLDEAITNLDKIVKQAKFLFLKQDRLGPFIGLKLK
jgi:hypothetical protein